MVLKIALVGLSPTTHDFAPFFDTEWECWGLPWDEGYWLHYDRLFEMHDLRLLESDQCKRRPGYIDRLKTVDVPLFMQQAYFPSALAYPLDIAPRGYYNSSISYAMAMAIHEKPVEIAVYGVDMDAKDEYAYQRPNMEYLIGYAEGKGIKVSIPEMSPLCKFNGEGIDFYSMKPNYVDRYGWLG